MDNPGPVRESASKRKIITAGKALFHKYGYRKVTIEEICKEGGVSKMTFYRFFENKIDLVKCILREIAEEGWEKYLVISRSDISFEDKIRATIQMKSSIAGQYSDDLLKDIYSDTDSGLSSLLQELAEEMMSGVLQDYRIAQDQGHIRKDLNLNFIPYFLNQINTLMNDPELVNLYDGNFHEIMTELTNLFFYGILQKSGIPKNES